MRMLRFLKSLPPREWAIVAGAVALFGIVEFVLPWDRLFPAAPLPVLAAGPECPAVRGTGYAPLMFGPKSATVYQGVNPPIAEIRDAITEAFQGQDYYGAYSRSAAGAEGWTYGYGSPAEARRAALALCESHGDPCRVVAELRPDPDHKIADCAQTLSPYQQESFVELRASPEPHRAFARSFNGDFGWAQEDSAEEAARMALRKCASEAANFEDLIDSPCEVVAVWQDGKPVPPEDQKARRVSETDFRAGRFD